MPQACFTVYERWVETFVWLFVPFYSELKSLFILFFLLTRAKVRISVRYVALVFVLHESCSREQNLSSCMSYDLSSSPIPVSLIQYSMLCSPLAISSSLSHRSPSITSLASIADGLRLWILPRLILRPGTVMLPQLAIVLPPIAHSLRRATGMHAHLLLAMCPQARSGRRAQLLRGQMRPPLHIRFGILLPLHMSMMSR